MKQARNRWLFAFLATMVALVSLLAPMVPAIGSPKAKQEASATGSGQGTARKSRPRRSKRGGVAKDKYDILGPLMNEIGQELANIAGGDPEGIFLYVEITPDWVSPSVFQDDGKVVRYLDSDQSDLEDIVRQAWYTEPEGRRWSVMEYAVKDGAFDAKFKYPEEVDVEALDGERLEARLRARYRGRPILYPPPPKVPLN